MGMEIGDKSGIVEDFEAKFAEQVKSKGGDVGDISAVDAQKIVAYVQANLKASPSDITRAIRDLFAAKLLSAEAASTLQAVSGYVDIPTAVRSASKSVNALINEYSARRVDLVMSLSTAKTPEQKTTVENTLASLDQAVRGLKHAAPGTTAAAEKNVRAALAASQGVGEVGLSGLPQASIKGESVWDIIKDVLSSVLHAFQNNTEFVNGKIDTQDWQSRGEALTLGASELDGPQTSPQFPKHLDNLVQQYRGKEDKHADFDKIRAQLSDEIADQLAAVNRGGSGHITDKEIRHSAEAMTNGIVSAYLTGSAMVAIPHADRVESLAQLNHETPADEAVYTGAQKTFAGYATGRADIVSKLENLDPASAEANNLRRVVVGLDQVMAAVAIGFGQSADASAHKNAATDRQLVDMLDVALTQAKAGKAVVLNNTDNALGSITTDAAKPAVILPAGIRPESPGLAKQRLEFLGPQSTQTDAFEAQQIMHALGAKLGSTGPKKDGVDGEFGGTSRTQMADIFRKNQYDINKIKPQDRLAVLRTISDAAAKKTIEQMTAPYKPGPSAVAGARK